MQEIKDVPLLGGEKAFTLAVKLNNNTWQFWTGTYVLLPGFPNPLQMKAWPIWTAFPDKAMTFVTQESAMDAVENHDNEFGWAKSIQVLGGKLRRRQ